jgi:transposase
MSEMSLTSWQRRRLRRQLRQTRDARVYRRTLALLQIDRGLPPSQVAEELVVSRQSIHNWLQEYARGRDPAALTDRGRAGRPGYRDSGLRGEPRWLMGQSPDRFGYPAAEWTVPLLLDELARGTGLRPSDDTLRRELGRLGYAWQRGRYALDPDPELEKKTADPQGNPPPAAAQRRAGPGRDRLAAVAARAGRLGPARAAV